VNLSGIAFDTGPAIIILLLIMTLYLSPQQSASTLSLFFTTISAC